MIQPATIMDFNAVYKLDDGTSTSFILPAGTLLSRVDGGDESPLEYIVHNPALLRKLVGPIYDNDYPYCFVPEEVANVSLLSQDTAVINVETSLDVPWTGATIGYFDPITRCREMYGCLPTPQEASTGCRETFGLNIPRERRRWEWSEYSLRTSVEGLILDIRSRLPASHGRRLGYSTTFKLSKMLDDDIRAYRVEHGVRIDVWDMPEGTLCHRACAALDEAISSFAEACGLEKVPQAPTPFSP